MTGVMSKISALARSTDPNAFAQLAAVLRKLLPSTENLEGLKNVLAGASGEAAEMIAALIDFMTQELDARAPRRRPLT